MRTMLIQFLHNVGLYKPVRWLVIRCQVLAWRIFNFITKREEKEIKAYLTSKNVNKLHLGCGLNYIKGWLNTDLMPGKERFRLDVSKDFQFPDNTFDYAFSEHVIEHMPYEVGKKMLVGCFKSLKPNGVLRISTPDIKFLIDLYQNDKNGRNREYIEWNAKNFIKDQAPHNAISVVNNYVRDWGHQYIYDVKSLSNLLEAIGFTDIKELELGKSSHENLAGLENETRHPAGFLALESLVLEARKPVWLGCCFLEKSFPLVEN